MELAKSAGLMALLTKDNSRMGLRKVRDSSNGRMATHTSVSLRRITYRESGSTIGVMAVSMKVNGITETCMDSECSPGLMEESMRATMSMI